MLSYYFLEKPVYWIIPWVIQSIAYFFILKKMRLRRWTAIIPFLAEREMSTVLFRRMRSFYRPFIITAVFVIGAYYLGPLEGTGRIYMYIAYIVYGWFLIRLYWRLRKSFGKSPLYMIGLIAFPGLFLLILALGKSRFTAPEFPPEKPRSKLANFINKALVFVISAAEIAALVCAVGFFTIKKQPPRIIVGFLQQDLHEKSKNIISDNSAVSREKALGSAVKIADMPQSRELFFPDHSNDKSVVVMTYIVGADLETQIGAASANIRMMEDATEKGDALTFVCQAGASKRWFTNGIDDRTYGRYTIRNGKVEKVESLPDTTSMEEPEDLLGFITWAKEKYPADRYMLVLWDHGGGLTGGYARDEINHRQSEDDSRGFEVAEMAEVFEKAGVKFDVIGFDACLMQTVECANAFEPYADYYLASEETEGGFGWFYTDAFGALAKNPGLSSIDFGKRIISTYDQFCTAQHDGVPKTDSTLSFVDLTRIKPAYEKLTALLTKADAALRKDSKDFAEIGLAASNAYAFIADCQIDLIDFLEKLADTDYDDTIAADAEIADVIKSLRAAVVFRNIQSAKGINGLAFAFPYKSIDDYPGAEKQLGKLGFDAQKAFSDDVFSIIAYENNEETKEKLESKSFLSVLVAALTKDHTQDEWYVAGFENYAPDANLVDVPVTEKDGIYSIELPEQSKDLIAESKVSVYQKEGAKLRMLGTDYSFTKDADRKYAIDPDGTWVFINGRAVSYTATGVSETEQGFVYKGDVKARLNNLENIIIHVEWDAVQKGVQPTEGMVTGYDYADENMPIFMSRGTQKFETGDKIEFIFDYQDEDGKIIGTESCGGSLRVTSPEKISVSRRSLGKGELRYMGRLTDVYQREYLTEGIDVVIN